MNSRERVLAAIAHKETDRIPIDLGSSPVTGIAASTYTRLKESMGIHTPTRIDVGQQLAFVEEDVQRRLGTDVRRVGGLPLEWKPWTFSDGTQGLIDAGARIDINPDGSQLMHLDAGAKMVMPPGGWFFDVVPEYQPLRNASTIAEIGAIFAQLPTYVDDARKADIIAQARQLRAAGEFATFGIFPTAIFESWFYRGFECFLMDFLADPEFATALMNIHADYHVEFWRPVLEEIGGDIDVLFVSDDLGSQSGLLVSEDVYCEQVKPLHAKYWSALRRMAPNAKLFLHSCGAIEPLIPHFIELGVDILNPIQVSAKGMDPKILKQKYGRDITFWGGGIDTQGVLVRGTTAQIKDDVRRHIEAMAPGGGFVFAAVHDIQPGTPVENIMAMFEAVEEYGRCGV